MGWTVSYDRLSSISLLSCLLTFVSFRSFLITSFHVFLGHPLGKLALALKILHLLDQLLSSILSRLSNHCIVLSCKHSLMLFNFSLVLSSSAEILSSDLTLHNHLTILAPFLSSMLTFSSLTGLAKSHFHTA